MSVWMQSACQSECQSEAASGAGPCEPLSHVLNCTTIASDTACGSESLLRNCAGAVNVCRPQAGAAAQAFDAEAVRGTVRVEGLALAHFDAAALSGLPSHVSGFCGSTNWVRNENVQRHVPKTKSVTYEC